MLLGSIKKALLLFESSMVDERHMNDVTSLVAQLSWYELECAAEKKLVAGLM